METMVSGSPGFNWLGHRVFVTGATGLLGSWIVRDLQERGADVVALVRDRVPQSLLWSSGVSHKLTSVHGELEDYGLLARALNEYEIETVLHLGAQTIVPIANRSPLSTFEANIRGTWNVLEAARATPTVAAVAVASSDKAYGDHHVLPYNESMALVGRYPYDVSKSCTDLISFSYHHTYGLPICITRCGNFYGPGDLNFNRIVPGTIRSVLRGEPPLIRSNGLLVRDYLYVRDASLAYLRLAECMHESKLSGEAYNFSYERPLGVLELVDIILGLMSSDAEPRILNNGTGEIEKQYLSSEKARRELGWEPAYTLEQGLSETIAWYRSFVGEDAITERR